jgi:hypothetical protein
MPGKSSFSPLAEPFFTLEYDPLTAAFARKIPKNAEDLGGGRFRYKGRLLALPESAPGEDAPLRKKVITGKELLSLARRGYSPLIKTGPLPAEREDRLMELGLKSGLPGPGRKRPLSTPLRHGAGADEITVILKFKSAGEEWLPLEGLPNYRLWQNRLYEIIPTETLEKIFPRGPDQSGVYSVTLRGGEIPAFADSHARLIYIFAGPALYSVISQENLFIPEEEISLVLRLAPEIERGVGKAIAAPALQYDKKLFSAAALSRQFRSPYIALTDKWVRRETLEQKGIGPLGRYVNGESLESFGIKGRDIFFTEGLRGLWEKAEFDQDRWKREGSEQEIFCSHLEFLRTWGISGGVISGGDRGKTAAYLASWLKSLAAALESERPEKDEGEISASPPAGRVLFLMRKSFWEHWLGKELPHSGEEELRWRGIDLGFYRDLIDRPPASPGSRLGGAWDILIMAAPEEALAGGEGASLRKDMLVRLQAIRTRLRLGVFFSSRDLFYNSQTREIKFFFGLKGNLGEIEKYLVRETGDFLSLPPARPRLPPAILKSPAPWQDRRRDEAGAEAAERTGKLLRFGDEGTIIGGGRFFIEARFQNLKSAEYRSEQESFFSPGKRRLVQAAFVPAGPAGQDAPPGFNRLSQEEREYFFWWRNEFRRGRNRETGRPYIFLYARELILLMGGGKPKEALDELKRLWEAYREVYPDLDRFFPKWILDFAILYKTGESVPASVPPRRCRGPGAGLLWDLYLHRKYIEDNNSLDFSDFAELLPGLPGGRGESAGNAFSLSMEEALNRADRFLRTEYGKKLLEFFYPLPARKETINAFEGLPGLGSSAYTAEWISFSAHEPFISFLASLGAWLEHRRFMDPLWKYLTGFEERPPEELGLKRVDLEMGKISRLREDSDAVRDLLHIEKEEEPPFTPNPPPSSSFPSPSTPRPSSSLRAFFEELSGLEQSALELIANGGGRKELEELAREKGVMIDIVLDGINGRFMEARGDLLLELSLDEEPLIHAEYRDEVLWALTFQKG